MMKMDLQVDSAEFRKEFEELELDATLKILMLFEQVGWETISYLRSFTNKMQPPVRVNEMARRAHPGGWADISGELAGAYRFEIWAGGSRVKWTKEGENTFTMGSFPNSPRPPFVLWLINDMEYAAALEAKDGYFVITGVTEAGGEVETAIRRAVASLGFEIE